MTAPTTAVPWRGGVDLDAHAEWEYTRDQADYDGAE